MLAADLQGEVVLKVMKEVFKILRSRLQEHLQGGSSAQSDEDSMLAARRFTRGSSAENDEESIQDSMSLEKRIMSDSGQSDEDSMLAAKRRRINSSEDSMMGGLSIKKSKKNVNKQKIKLIRKQKAYEKHKTNKKKLKANTKKRRNKNKYYI